MTDNDSRNGRARHLTTLAACMLLTGALGSVHAFSVLVLPLEMALAASRSNISLIYSLALASLTVAVLFGHRIYSLAKPPLLLAAICAVAASGLAIAAYGHSLSALLVGYGVLFGAANGVGYGYSLQLAAQAMPARKGLAMGSVTAVYALGATLFSKVLAVLVDQHGITTALLGLASVLAACALLTASLLLLARASYRAATPIAAGDSGPDRRLLARLWAAYGLASAAGLMAIGHAAGIVAAAGGEAQLRVAGAMLIGLGNAAGGFVAGGLADRLPPKRLLAVLPLLSCAALGALIGLTGNPTLTLAALCVIGFAYGAIIAIYPFAVTHYFGIEASAKIYGQVFTAWGLAGLGAPWLAGALYDASGDYTWALLIAALSGLCSAAIAVTVPATSHSNAQRVR